MGILDELEQPALRGTEKNGGDLRGWGIMPTRLVRASGRYDNRSQGNLLRQAQLGDFQRDRPEGEAQLVSVLRIEELIGA